MKILDKKILAGDKGIRIILLKVYAPQICARALPGQFIVLMASEEGERVPLTIVEKDRESITLIFQEAGFTTKLLGRMGIGESLYSISGPLGRATEIKNYGSVVLVGGGVGVAEIYPVARAMREAGNHVTSILGARTKDLLILEEELKSVSDELHITTDDGSYGRKGFVTDILKELLGTKTPFDSARGKQEHKATGLVYAVGPVPMMREISGISFQHNIRAIVSLNALMVDATGMCGCCRVTIKGETKFTCVDGPEFDGSQVDWDELSKRNKIYAEQENHICKLIKT